MSDQPGQQVLMLLHRRLARRRREFDIAWKLYRQFDDHKDPSVVRPFRQKAEVCLAQLNECRLIIQQIKRSTAQEKAK
jgi:hypothetical protein